MSRVQKNNDQNQQTTQNSEPTKRKPTIAPVKRKDFRRLTKSPFFKKK
ncbi:hypothetical protein [Bacillus sp. ISL-57]|nr:hypothetical protein [Bacillus sp. ISL-57]MBT2716595.1 hypothetical protein [Bacillus sp. ISL-57]